MELVISDNSLVTLEYTEWISENIGLRPNENEKDAAYKSHLPLPNWVFRFYFVRLWVHTPTPTNYITHTETMNQNSDKVGWSTKDTGRRCAADLLSDRQFWKQLNEYSFKRHGDYLFLKYRIILLWT